MKQAAFQGRGGVLFPLLTAALGHFVVDFMVGIWPVYKTLFQLDLMKAGVLAGVCASIGEGTQLYWGPLADGGKRRLVLFLGVLLSLSAVGLAYVESYPAYGLLLLCAYLGSGAFHPSGGSLAFNLDPQRRGLMVGIFAAGGGMGLACSQMGYSTLFQWMDGQTLWLLLPALAVLGCVLLYPATAPQSFPRKQSVWKGIRSLLKLPHMRQLYMGQLLNQGFYWGIIFLLPDLLKERGYAPWVFQGGGHFAMILGLATMTVPMGLLADRWGVKGVHLACQLGAFLFVSWILIFPELPVDQLCPLLFLLGACAGSMSPLAVVWGNQLHPGSPGLVTGFFMGFVWLISEGVGPGLGGALTLLFQEGQAAKALGVLSLFLLGSLALIRSVPNRVPIPFPQT